jgi:GNAT superfamily N-acetyltransferase
MSVASDLELLDVVNALVYREATVRSGGRVLEQDGLTLIVGTHPSPVIINSILRTGPVADPARALEAARAEYDAIGHGVSLMTSAHADEELARAAAGAGWMSVFELVGMILDGPLLEAAMPAGVSVFEADPVADLAGIRRIEVEGFGESDDERAMIETVFGDPAMIDSPGTATYLARVDDPGAGPQDVAAAIVDRAPAALITWVATLPEFRRRGLGGLVTAAAANRGFEMGCPAVVLQASPMGLPVYRRLGFRPLGGYTIWEPPGTLRHGALGRPTRSSTSG